MEWKKEYIEKLSAVDLDDSKIDDIEQLKINNFPKFLYKFREVNKYSLENLRMGTVWLSSPKKYNDPFECVEYKNISKISKLLSEKRKKNFIENNKDKIPKSILKSAMKSKDIITYLLKHHLKVNENKSREEIENITKSISDLLNKEYEKKIIEFNQLMQEKLKLCSFCESPQNILMWSHYANHHKGFCIEYDFSKLRNSNFNKLMLFPVIYQNKLFDSTEHIIHRIKYGRFNKYYSWLSCATKSMFWVYEQEWRLIFFPGLDFEEQNYNMDIQSRVFLGLRISKNNIKKITKICDEKNIPIMIPKQSLDKFKLEFTPL